MTNKESIFFVIFFLLLGSVVLLGYFSWVALIKQPMLVPTFFIQFLQTASFFTLLGLGLGLPLILLATIFGWLQVILLVSGNIDPHLGEEGFFNVLKTLCGFRN